MMVKATSEQQSAPPSPSQHSPRRRFGQLPTQGTVLATIMRTNGLRKYHIIGVIGCSDRQLTRYLARETPMSPIQIVKLCEHYDLDPSEVMDDRGYLLPDGGHDS